MAKASIQQRKLFFALCREAGLDSEEGKEKAKKKLGLESFKDINPKQISELIEKLQAKIQKTQNEKRHNHNFELEAKSDKHKFYSCECGTIVIEPR